MRRLERKAEAVQQSRESRVGTQAVERRVDAEQAERLVTLGERRLKPREGPVVFAEGRVQGREVIARDVLTFPQPLQLMQDGPRFAPPLRRGVDAPEARQVKVSPQGRVDRAAALRGGLARRE